MYIEYQLLCIFNTVSTVKNSFSRNLPVGATEGVGVAEGSGVDVSEGLGVSEEVSSVGGGGPVASVVTAIRYCFLL